MLTLPEESGIDNKKPLKCCNILYCAFTVNHHLSVNLLMANARESLYFSYSSLSLPSMQQSNLKKSENTVCKKKLKTNSIT